MSSDVSKLKNEVGLCTSLSVNASSAFCDTGRSIVFATRTSNHASLHDFGMHRTHQAARQNEGPAVCLRPARQVQGSSRVNIPLSASQLSASHIFCRQRSFALFSSPIAYVYVAMAWKMLTRSQLACELQEISTPDLVTRLGQLTRCNLNAGHSRSLSYSGMPLRLRCLYSTIVLGAGRLGAAAAAPAPHRTPRHADDQR